MMDTIVVDRVSKSFGPTKALADVSTAIGRGESRALIGKNGAGKSTLMSILTGLTPPDSGAVHVLDEQGHSDFSAVGCVYQRSTLVPGATAAENVSLNRYPSRGGVIQWKAVRQQATDALQEWGCGHLADTIVEQLDPLERKVVEITRVLSTGPEVLLLDEPTAGLDRAGVQRLFTHIRQAHERGVTIIYVSHHLHEIFEVCDSVSVLRDGRLVLTEPLKELSVHELVGAMVGESAAEPRTAAGDDGRPGERTGAGKPLFIAHDLTAGHWVRGVTLEARAGECVGLTGLDGAGHMQLAEALTGQLRPDSGTVTIDGKALPLGDIARCIAAGIGFTPQDRNTSGYVPGLSVAENATSTMMSQFANRLGILNFRKRNEFYRGLAQEWDIKARDPDQATEELSGGNQQKVVLARSVARRPRVLVLMSPTAGVDVSARESIYRTIDELKQHGQSVVVATSDDADLEICDRILIMYRGEVIREMYPPYSEVEVAAAIQGSGTMSGTPADRAIASDKPGKEWGG